VPNYIRGKLYTVKQTEGTKGGVCGPADMHLADECVNKTQEMKKCIPTKSYACMSTSWSLGNMHMAKSSKGRESSQPF
jgi:hypothetical protein